MSSDDTSDLPADAVDTQEARERLKPETPERFDQENQLQLRADPRQKVESVV